jgi:predicted nucleic acid-binding protein
MIVVDTSAVLGSLVPETPNGDLLNRLLGEELHAPHLIDIEVLHALRGLERGGKLDAGAARVARDEVGRVAMTRYAHGALLDRAWELRHNLTAYDATFVALSEALGVPLVTTDARLAGASGHRAEVELY